MGQPDRDDLDPELLGRGHQPVGLAAGIDEHAFHRLPVPDQRSVLLQRRDGNDADVELGLGGTLRLLSLFGHGRSDKDYLNRVKVRRIVAALFISTPSAK